ncbi:RNA-directed DNA polymerase, eukaryota [Tanacetum coccineum]
MRHLRFDFIDLVESVFFVVEQQASPQESRSSAKNTFQSSPNVAWSLESGCLVAQIFYDLGERMLLMGDMNKCFMLRLNNQNEERVHALLMNPVVAASVWSLTSEDFILTPNILDDTCIKEFDFGMSLMGRVKDVSAIPNLPCIISKEGFQNVKLSYLGGMWVLFEFDSLTAKEKFLIFSGIGSWFTELIQATSSFENDERIVWISIEGLPIKAWTPNTFRKIASLWGEYVEWEDDDLKSLSCKHLCLKTNMKVIINERQKVIIQGKVYWIRVKELDAWFPNFQEDDQDDLSSDGESQEVDEPKFPPGFTPDNNDHEKNVAENIKDATERVQSLSNKLNDRCSNSGFSSQRSMNSHSQKSKVSGSILDLMDELVNVGQTMGYNMAELNERRDLWDYLRTIIDRWEGDTVIMGDFKEVRSEHERFGSTFNRQGAIAFNNFISSARLIDLPLEGYAFTWAHKSASKMSKLDCYLISDRFFGLFPHLSSSMFGSHLFLITVPIFMREKIMDYGPSPFRGGGFFILVCMKGFNSLWKTTWKSLNIVEPNGLIRLKKKLQALKIAIKAWSKEANKRSNNRKINIKQNLSEVDKLIDQGKSNDEILIKRIRFSCLFEGA